MGCCPNCETRCRECRQFMYNRNQNTFCEKTCSSWCKVIALYLTYAVIVIAVCLGGLFGINEYVKWSGLEGQFDKRTLLLNNTPRLTIIPKLKKTTLLWYTKGGNHSSLITPQYYVDYLDKFFKKYENLDPNIYVDCSNPKVDRQGKFCKFTKDMLGPCGKDGYGYFEDKPCIFLKLNKIRGWIPTAHEVAKHDTDEDSDDENEFSLLSQRINKPTGDQEDNYTITAECTGSTSFGCDHLGKIELHPRNCFQYYYFPYNGSDLYLSPLVGVQFLDLVKGLVIAISCSVWGFPTTEQVRRMLTAKVNIYIDD